MSRSLPGPVTPVVTPESMRDALGAFASGVVVVTAIGPDGPIGFTCQSFASLSLDPPLVSFAPSRGSSTWPRIREVGRFCVNVLAADHEHHSAGFARSGVDKFAGVTWEAAPSGSPVLDGVGAWIEATYNRTRRHSSLGMLSPVAFEHQLMNPAAEAA